MIMVSVLLILLGVVAVVGLVVLGSRFWRLDRAYDRRGPPFDLP